MVVQTKPIKPIYTNEDLLPAIVVKCVANENRTHIPTAKTPSIERT